MQDAHPPLGHHDHRSPVRAELQARGDHQPRGHRRRAHRHQGREPHGLVPRPHPQQEEGPHDDVVVPHRKGPVDREHREADETPEAGKKILIN